MNKFSVIVITYIGPDGKEKWMGNWENYKRAFPKAKTHDIETLHEYKKRLKPINLKLNSK